MQIYVCDSQKNLIIMSRQILNRSFIFTFLLAGFILAFSSCQKDDIIDIIPVETSNILVTHASPNAPGVDLLVDNVKQNSSALTYPANTGYLSVNSGTRNIKVNVTGTATTVINADLAFTKDQNYSIFAIDSVTDDLSAPAAGKAHVRFVHLSPNAPAVDVAVTGGGVVFGNQSFKQFTAFTPLDAGTYNLEVRVAGTATVALPLPGIVLSAGKIYTVYAKGFLGGTGAEALGAEIIVNK
jgi:Domain of unknown function (DUF4397)